MEKKIFSKRRLDILQQHQDLINAEKWGKYCYLPLDIPKFKNSTLVDWFFHNAKPSIRSDIETVKKFYDSISDVEVFENYYKANTKNLNNKNYSLYDSVDVVLESSIESKYQMWTSNIRNEFLDLFDDFYKQILYYFPFKKLKSFRIWSSTNEFPLHRDIHENFVDFPNLFRIMLYDTNPKSTLYVNNVLPGEKNTNKNFYIHRLDETNSFAINNLRVKHGSNFDSSHKKILILLDNYEIDNDRLDDLMQKSVTKYQDKCLVDLRCVSEYVTL